VLYYEGTSQDITERRRADVQLATLAHAIESTSEMICITDLQDRFAFVNRAFTLAYGYTPAEILGQTPAILFSPKNPPGLLEDILTQTRAGGWRGEVIDRRKDGSEFPVFLSTSQVRDRTGGCSVDGTPRHYRPEARGHRPSGRSGQTQAHADDWKRLVTAPPGSQMLDELHHVSYAMVHDMRAPLHTMRVYADLLADTERELDPSGTHDYLRRIAAAAARLDTLITDALKYTRVLHEQLPMEPVDLEGLIRGLIESYPNLRPELVEICLEAPLPLVLGNESRPSASQSLGNAASSWTRHRPQIRVRAERVQAPQTAVASSRWMAHDASRQPEPAVGMEKPVPPMRDHQPIQLLRIWVEDNGIGIPAALDALRS
jgi:PAS domain S-box-containing protein